MILIVIQKMLDHQIIVFAQNLNERYPSLLDLFRKLLVCLFLIFQPKSLDVSAVTADLPQHAT